MLTHENATRESLGLWQEEWSAMDEDAPRNGMNCVMITKCVPPSNLSSFKHSFVRLKNSEPITVTPKLSWERFRTE